MLATQRTSPPVPYLVQLSGVREVSLLGAADLQYWEDRLRPEALFPIEVNGEAQVQICACEGCFLGVCFREFSVSVRASRFRGAEQEEGVFLVQAYNSIRFFAFVERALYRTPYVYGSLCVIPQQPAYLDLTSPDGNFCTAMLPEQTKQPRDPSRCELDGWEGAVYLPRRSSRRGTVGEVFYARLEGLTEVYPFDEARDFVRLLPKRRAGALQALADSRFTVREWVIRKDATHGKSRTVSRPVA
jgi:hypothetical protein